MHRRPLTHRCACAPFSQHRPWRASWRALRLCFLILATIAAIRAAIRAAMKPARGGARHGARPQVVGQCLHEVGNLIDRRLDAIETVGRVFVVYSEPIGEPSLSFLQLLNTIRGLRRRALHLHVT